MSPAALLLSCILGAAAPAAPLLRTPKLSGKADVLLWHKALRHASAAARTPVFVRADDAAARATLGRLGVSAVATSSTRWGTARTSRASLRAPAWPAASPARPTSPWCAPTTSPASPTPSPI